MKCVQVAGSKIVSITVTLAALSLSSFPLFSCKKALTPIAEPSPSLVPVAGPLTPTAKAPARPPPTYREVRGVWLTNVDSTVLESAESIDKAFARLAKLGFTTVYPVVWNKGYTLFPSHVAQSAFGVAAMPGTNYATPGRDMLRDCVTSARKHGLEVIPWFESGLKIPANHPLVSKKPSWFTKAEDGSMFRDDIIKWAYLNPSIPEVRRFVLDLLGDAVTRYEVGGIHLDDHFSLYYKFGYDNANASMFASSLGSAAQSPKQELAKDPVQSLPKADSNDSAWIKSRAGVLTELMVQVAEEIRAKRAGTIISVSSNAYPWSLQNYMQDWPTWMRRGAIDEFVLQNYHAEFERFSRDEASLNAQLLQVPNRPYAVMGILSGLRSKRVTMTEVRRRIESSRRSGLGVAFFFYETLFDLGAPYETPEMRENIFAQLFAQSSFARRQPSQTVPQP
jgi:uncharacterized lipoprotein YddW (UPF0748 family)